MFCEGPSSRSIGPERLSWRRPSLCERPSSLCSAPRKCVCRGEAIGLICKLTVLSQVNDAFSAPHRSLRSDRGLTVDHWRIRVHKQEPPWSSTRGPKPRNKRRFVPCAKRGGQRTSESEGPLGAEQREDGHPQNAILRQRDLSLEARCTTHTPSYSAATRRGTHAQHKHLLQHAREETGCPMPDLAQR